MMCVYRSQSRTRVRTMPAALQRSKNIFNFFLMLGGMFCCGSYCFFIYVLIINYIIYLFATQLTLTLEASQIILFILQARPGEFDDMEQSSYSEPKTVRFTQIWLLPALCQTIASTLPRLKLGRERDYHASRFSRESCIHKIIQKITVFIKIILLL